MELVKERVEARPLGQRDEVGRDDEVDARGEGVEASRECAADGTKEKSALVKRALGERKKWEARSGAQLFFALRNSRTFSACFSVCPLSW